MSFRARLCRELVQEDFGDFPAKVTHQLLLKGRLSLHDIVRFTKLTQRQVRESLVTLIHHGIVYFTEPLEGQREPTYYQVEPVPVMMRLRIGSIMRVSEEQFGKEASTICKLLYVNGRLRLQDLREWVAENDGKPKTSMGKILPSFQNGYNQ
ncbi:RNA polymerase III subunit RPC82 helix-turn-helix domain-containing protein [Phascolomyces articulosus]|uniref:DNA-directed RNA polymerase III subunit RPC3 n=1 Tax=Phascolomyces articulosus TaxID=60185 RepID=A0AAD5PA42_9FUNG|nr:RNA polymerase III subunit RPC82 helix-turn-helix domain-containing protein [Phascolomyces articulosus]